MPPPTIMMCMSMSYGEDRASHSHFAKSSWVRMIYLNVVVAAA